MHDASLSAFLIWQESPDELFSHRLHTGKLAIKFYLVAILFILFDVELVFLYPWAVVYRTLGVLGLVEMGVFLGILMVGYAYAWDTGALDWE